MLHSEYLGTACGDGRCHTRVRHSSGGHRDVHRLGQVHASEHNACIRRCGPQRQLHTLPAVQADTNGFGQRFQSSLSKHLVILIDGPAAWQWRFPMSAIAPENKAYEPVTKKISAFSVGFSVGLLAQESRDFKVIHAARCECVDLCCSLGAVGTPHAGHTQVAVVGLHRTHA